MTSLVVFPFESYICRQQHYSRRRAAYDMRAVWTSRVCSGLIRGAICKPNRAHPIRLSIRIHLRLFAAILAVALAVPGCSRHGSSSSLAVLRYPIIQEPSTMDPVRIQDVYTNEL